MTKNNFKQLEEVYISRQPPHARKTIENNIHSNMGLISYVGRVVELYIPRVLDMIISLIGGNSESVVRGPSNPSRPNGPGIF